MGKTREIHQGVKRTVDLHVWFFTSETDQPQNCSEVQRNLDRQLADPRGAIMLREPFVRDVVVSS